MQNRQAESKYHVELQSLQEQNALMRKLGGNLGFFQYYFEQLKHFRTQFECFEHVNGLHMDFFGEYRFSGYKSFSEMYRRNLKKLK